MSFDDRAEETEQLLRTAALSIRKPVLKPVGQCYNCGEMVIGVFCDKDCADDFEHRETFNKGLE